MQVGGSWRLGPARDNERMNAGLGNDTSLKTVLLYSLRYLSMVYCTILPRYQVRRDYIEKRYLLRIVALRLSP